MKRFFSLALLVFLLGCNAKNVDQFSVEQNEIRLRDGLRIHVDETMRLAGSGDGFFPFASRRYQFNLKGESLVFVKTSDGFTVTDFAGVGFCPHKFEFLVSFAGPYGETRELGGLTYHVLFMKGDWDNPYLKSLFSPCRSNGFSTTINEHYVVVFFRANKRSVRTISYAVDAKTLPADVQTGPDVRAYLEGQFYNTFTIL